MKKLLAILLTVAMLAAMCITPARATTITGTGYSFDDVTGELTVTTDAGTTAWRTEGVIGPASQQSTYDLIKSVSIESGVTNIGENAFADCGNLTAADFPAGLISIGRSAFYGCANLATVDLSGCKSLTTINDFVFTDCTSLNTVELPARVVALGSQAFANCANLNKLIFPGTINVTGTAPFDRAPLTGKIYCLPSAVDSYTTRKNETSSYGFNLSGWTVEAGVTPDNILPSTLTNTMPVGTVGTDYSAELTATGTPFLKFSLDSGDLPAGLNLAKDGTISGTPTAAGTSVFRVKVTNAFVGYATEQLSITIAAVQPPPPSGGNSPVPPIDETVKPGTDKPEEKPEVTEPEVTEPVAPTLPTGPQQATPTTSKVFINGVEVEFTAYNINDNNYYKLRDLAAALSGSEKQFEVLYNALTATIELTSGEEYTKVGGELAGAAATENVIANPTDNKIVLDGKEIALTAYNIKENNYFKLRDIAEAFDFFLEWDEATGDITIDTSKGYTK